MTTFPDPAPAAVPAAPLGVVERLKRAADVASADLVLGLAARVRELSESEHPDLLALRATGLTVTGRPVDLVHAAVDLVTQEFSEAAGVGLDSALSTVWAAWYDATDRGPVWQAVAEGRITVEQARTITARAARLSRRVATITEVRDDTGRLVELAVVEGDHVIDPAEQPAVLAGFLQRAVAWASDGVLVDALARRCNRLTTDLTPGFVAVTISRPEATRELVVEACEDDTFAHVTLVLPAADAIRLKAFATAAADATADAESATGTADARDHATRVNDAAADLIADGLAREVLARSDCTTPADADHPVVQGRTHRPASSVQVHVSVDASTLAGLDEHDGFVAGLGPVPAPVARALAGDAGASWRAVVTAPGTRTVIDVAATAYRPTAALRRFVTARDDTCQGFGCRTSAIDCDLDHVIAWPQGPSTAENLQALCRTHHRFKTQYIYESTTANRRRNTARPRPPAPPRPVDDSPPPF
ncbi:HNH endonuclease [Kineococcus rubinsiae]|uniref:HNH endonuclease n=1 Tax=Kineococcus rubinsiae TaxID=2609562 RepID=UPI001431E2AD|nr:HNH endonuclease signature motif containing protein [Kineococcus rubinsiae]NIZ93216.1 DUF222 domain-containing protein [Kineococcus rubinsiae]